MEFFNIVNGECRSSDDVHQGINPRTEELLWKAPLATVADLDEAVAAAEKALPEWSGHSLAERQALLVKLAETMKAHSAELQEIVMQETGKSRILAQIEIGNSCHQTLYYSKVGLEDEVAFEDDTVKIISTHSPLGVIGAICPWNFPVILSNIKIVSALVTGNCVIVKPSPFTPYCVMKAAEICQSIFPPGVLQVLNGGADLGAAMTLHPGIAGITFTGTIATGRRVMASCAKTLKRFTLELAGNDAAIICDDVDIPSVAAKVAGGSFFNGGQVCVATKRVYVPESIYDEFLKAFVTEVQKSYAVTDNADTPSVFGPISNKMQFEIVSEIVRDCKENGYDVVAGGEPSTGKGFWIPPTVVSKPPEDSVLVREEQFGPIIPLLSYKTEEDALARANLANAGLGASVYSSDVARAERIARKLQAGSVWINMSEKPNPGAFFSGHKDSGYGGEMGKQGLLSYCYTKSLHFSKGATSAK